MLVYCILFLVPLVLGQAPTPEPNCLGCICEASTRCNATTACNVPGPGKYFCGPFQISYAYWQDAGQPIIQGDDPNRRGAFENCVNDLHCAASTVRLYMEKFGKDCNNDGQVDCLDYANIHVGGLQCMASGFDISPFGQRFNGCFNVVKAALPNGSGSSRLRLLDILAGERRNEMLDQAINNPALVAQAPVVPAHLTPIRDGPIPQELPPRDTEGSDILGNPAVMIRNGAFASQAVPVVIRTDLFSSDDQEELISQPSSHSQNRHPFFRRFQPGLNQIIRIPVIQINDDLFDDY